MVDNNWGFLKGIGLNVDEALKFWSSQFTKNNSMSLETFNKDYKYNIRHQYGLEGQELIINLGIVPLFYLNLVRILNLNIMVVHIVISI